MILVTGATGYIGRRLAGLLLERYSRKEILCLVRPSDGSRKEQSGRDNLRSLGLEICEADLLSAKGLNYLPKSPQIIFHLTSCTDTSA